MDNIGSGIAWAAFWLALAYVLTANSIEKLNFIF